MQLKPAYDVSYDPAMTSLPVPELATDFLASSSSDHPLCKFPWLRRTKSRSVPLVS